MGVRERLEHMKSRPGVMRPFKVGAEKGRRGHGIASLHARAPGAHEFRPGFVRPLKCGCAGKAPGLLFRACCKDATLFPNWVGSCVISEAPRRQ